MPEGVPGLMAISGPLMLGYLFNWCLLGVFSVQAYFYFLAFPRDRRTTKALIAGLCILELAQTILLTHDAFSTYAIHFSDVGYLSKTQVLPFSIPMFTGVVGLIVQMHYGYLLRVISDSRLLGLIVAFFAVVQCSASIIKGTQCFVINDVSELGTKTFASEMVWCVTSVVCDLIIAFGMIFVLLRKDTGLPVTRAISITNLVRVTVETGCLTAICATIQMVLFISLPDKPYFTCVGFALSKLYSNSLLALLNSRIRIEGVHTHSAQHAAISSLAFLERSTDALPFASITPGKGTGPHVVDIRIQSDVHLEAWSTTLADLPMDDDKSGNSSTAHGFE